MKRKRSIFWICLAALAFLPVPLILSRFQKSGGSTYERRVEADLFFLEMKPLNDTLKEIYSLHEGDTIDVSVVLVSGELRISIGQENRKLVYEGKNPESGSFQVTVPEDGDYTISVTGNRAEGSISFRINGLE